MLHNLLLEVLWLYSFRNSASLYHCSIKCRAGLYLAAGGSWDRFGYVLLQKQNFVEIYADLLQLLNFERNFLLLYSNVCRRINARYWVRQWMRLIKQTWAAIVWYVNVSRWTPESMFILRIMTTLAGCFERYRY